MAPDIFSSLDPAIYSKSTSLFWIWWPMMMTLMVSAIKLNDFNIMLNMSKQPIQKSNETSQGSQLMLGFYTLIPNLFVFTLMMNLSGLIPYIFSFSSHLVTTLSMGVPLWLLFVLSSAAHSPKKFIASLLPSGAPAWLNPILCLIETISMMIRPITLSVRLAANMTAGHVILSLMSIALSSLLFSSYIAAPTLLIQTGYTMFEMMICMIQAFIFCLLITIYSNDHSWLKYHTGFDPEHETHVS